MLGYKGCSFSSNFYHTIKAGKFVSAAISVQHPIDYLLSYLFLQSCHTLRRRQARFDGGGTRLASPTDAPRVAEGKKNDSGISLKRTWYNADISIKQILYFYRTDGVLFSNY